MLPISKIWPSLVFSILLLAAPFFMIEDVASGVGAHRCLAPPIHGSGPPDVVTRDTASGPETTEFFGHGVYRVNRCGAGGTLKISQLVGPVPVPDGVAQLPYATTERVPGEDIYGTVSGTYDDPDDPAWATAWAAGRAKALAKVLPPTAPAESDGATTASSGGGPDDGCAHPDFWTNGWRWANNSHSYYTALDANLPGGYTGRLHITQGQLNWTYTYNSCGQTDVSPYAAWWAGGVCCWYSGNRDYVPYIDYGDVSYLGCDPIYLRHIACAIQWGPYGYTDEADIRFQAYGYVNWYAGNVPVPDNAVDLQATATHEAGHSLGLAHVSPTWLTMNTYIQRGKAHQRSLGWGDYTGMQTLYP